MGICQNWQLNNFGLIYGLGALSMTNFMNKLENYEEGPSGAILRDLPSVYIPHRATGLLHLPRFIAKIKKHLELGELPKSYRKNFCRGFDRFLCMHLGIEPEQVVEIVARCQTDEAIDEALQAILPEDLRVAAWNREIVQKGMSAAGREFILQSLTEMGVPERAFDILSIADMIDLDEGRIPGYDPCKFPAKDA